MNEALQALERLIDTSNPDYTPEEKEKDLDTIRLRLSGPTFDEVVNVIRHSKEEAQRKEFDMGTGLRAKREENSLIIQFCDYLEKRLKVLAPARLTFEDAVKVAERATKDQIERYEFFVEQYNLCEDGDKDLWRYRMFVSAQKASHYADLSKILRDALKEAAK